VCKTGPPPSCKAPAQPCNVATCVSQGPDKYGCATLKAKDGAACDDGDACMLGSVCKSGSCTKGTEPVLFQRKVVPKRKASGKVVDGLFKAAATRGGGGAWFGGAWASRSGVTKEGGWWLMAVDGAGKVVHESAGDQGWLNEVAAMLPAGGGPVVAGAVEAKAGGKTRAAIGLSGHDAAGKVLWSAQHADPSGDLVASSMGRYIDGTLSIAGAYESTKELRGVVLRTAKTGTHLAIHKGIANSSYDSLAVLGDGGVFVGGKVFVGSLQHVGHDALLLRVSADGKTLWQRRLRRGEDAGIGVVAALASGDLLAGGYRAEGTKKRGWRLRATASGDVSWERTEPTALFAHAIALHLAAAASAPVAAERFVAAGSVSGPSGEAGPWYAGVDGLGNAQWLESSGGGKDFGSLRAVVIDDAGIWLAGEAGKGDTTGLVVRADHYGHASCASSGSCLGKGVKACNDGNPCTTDACSPKGCLHAPKADLACDLSDGCTAGGICEAGKCKPSPRQRLFAKTLAMPTIDKALSITEGGDGGLQVIGFGDGRLHVVKLSALGEVLSARMSPSKGAYSAITGAIPLADGSVIALLVGKATYQCGLMRFTPELKPAKLAKIPMSVNKLAPCRPRALLDLDGGKHVMTVASRNVDPPSWSRYRVADLVRTGGGNAMAGAGGRQYPRVGGRVLADGNALLVGYSTRYSEPVMGRVSRIEPAGKGQLHHRFYRVDNANIGTRLYSGAIVPSGGLLLVGERQVDGVYRPLLIHESDSGKVLWTWSGGGGDQWTPTFAIRGPGHAITLAGNAPVGKGAVWLRRVDPLGAVLSAHAYQSPGQVLSAAPGVPAVLTADGGFALLADAAKDGLGRFFVVRADAGGHASCADAGGCKDPEESSCDDKNACTLDTCEGAGGKPVCKHKTMPCVDGNSCTLDKCDTTKGCVHPPRSCDDNNPCSVDECEHARGCFHRKNHCSDGDPCTADTCTKAKGCVSKALPDGFACSHGDCTAGICKSGTCTGAKKDDSWPGCSAKTAVPTCRRVPVPGPKGKSGVFWLDPDEGGPVKPFRAYCDMQTDGGGWMLLHNFRVDPSAGLPKGGLTRAKATVVPTDLQGYSWARADALGYAADGFSEVRFYCNTVTHARVVHFKTANKQQRSTAFNGSQAGMRATDWNAGFTTMSGHSASFPGGVSWVLPGHNGFAGRYVVGGKVGTPSWDLWSSNYFRFFCDDGCSHCGTGNTKGSTHRVWIR